MRYVAKGFARCAIVALSLTAGMGSAQELAPGAAGAYLAARQASEHNDYRAAARLYTEAMTYEPSNTALTENAMSAYMALGDFQKAERLGKRMIAAGSTSQIAHMALIVSEAQRGAYDEMSAAFEAGTRVGPLVDGLLRGWAAIGAGRFEDGMAAFDAIAERQGLKPFAAHHKALAYGFAGDFESAADIFSGATYGALPDNRRGLLANVMVLSQLGRNDDARAEIGRVMGPELDATFSSIDARLAAGEALPFSEIMSAADGMAEVFYTVSSALDGEAADSYALLYSRVAEALNPRHIEALLLSGSFLERLGRPELATLAYDRVPREAPEYITAEIARADALRAAERPDAAAEAMQQLAKAYPDVPAVHAKLGDTLRRLERFGEAVKAYDAALALHGDPHPDHWFSYFARGISNEREGDWPAAESDFRMALELRPNQPQVMNYLGYSLVEKNMKLDEALEMIEAAATARPDSGHILDSLGWVLYRLGRYDEAVGPMETAVELMATDPVINDHLGDVYWAVGRYTEAHFQWLRALSFDPEAEEAERIRRKIDVGLDIVLEEEGLEPLAVATDG
ncbi:MAG: tetratricopeptide repeat protein [Rhodobacteraceae bacterium]|nr:tetratricopeptide repeat protein [Paracoccaceae bacterium]